MQSLAQSSFKFMNHGGRRKGAGRKKLRANEPAHTARAKINERTPFHAGLSFVEGAPNLRQEKFMTTFLQAVELAKQKGLRTNHYAIEGNHIHLIGEADSNEALKRGMTSLTTSIAWAFKKLFAHLGKVFAKRYFLHAIKHPREMRHALQYVIFNHAKHLNVAAFQDVYSSAHLFTDINRFYCCFTKPPPRLVRTQLALSPAKSWLQTVGWKR